MRTWARQQRGESDESFAMRKRTRATNELHAILATPEGREALKALLTDTPRGRSYDDDTVAQLVDALDSPEGDA